MRSRRKLPPKMSKGLFTHTAKSTHPRNILTRPMRGGIRA